MDYLTAGYRKADALRSASMDKAISVNGLLIMEQVLRDGREYEYYVEMKGDLYELREIAFAKGRDDVVGNRVVRTFDRDGRESRLGD